MNPLDTFKQEVKENIKELGRDQEIKEITKSWVKKSFEHKYSYNFRWMDRPIIQYPQDIVMMQELIYQVKPDLIIETGIAHGGSLILYASILELIGSGKVLGIDIDIREHNRVAIEKHPMFKRIEMLQGSSIDQEIVDKVHEYARDCKKVMVILDSNHTYEHVKKELECYASLVSKDSYLVVFDTIVEQLGDELCKDRPWGKGDNAKIAVDEFMQGNDRFIVDQDIDNKLLITMTPGGYLKCIK